MYSWLGNLKKSIFNTLGIRRGQGHNAVYIDKEDKHFSSEISPVASTRHNNTYSREDTTKDGLKRMDKHIIDTLSDTKYSTISINSHGQHKISKGSIATKPKLIKVKDYQFRVPVQNISEVVNDFNAETYASKLPIRNNKILPYQ